MLPTTLVLIRHGHVADNDPGDDARLCGWSDPPLSALGRWQVEQLRARLAGEPPAAAVYTSPLHRAAETARTVTGDLGMPLWLRRSLREIGCGAVDGWPLWQVKRRYPELWVSNLSQADEHFRWPGGESYRAFRSRTLRAIEGIATAHRGRRVIVVTHAGVITQLLGALRGTSAARWDAFRVGNASITEVRWHDGSGAVRRFDDRRHLATAPWMVTHPSTHRRAG